MRPMYHTKILEAAGSYHCEISYKPTMRVTPKASRVRYKDISNWFNILQAAIVILSAF